MSYFGGIEKGNPELGGWSVPSDQDTRPQFGGADSSEETSSRPPAYASLLGTQACSKKKSTQEAQEMLRRSDRTF